MNSVTTNCNTSALTILCHCSDEKLYNDPLYLSSLQICVDKGNCVNCKPESGNSCLHAAALSGNCVAIKFCLDNGAFLNTLNKFVLIFI